ncbi:unnamed protein product [Protopolystoma xenopodis]|uniref:Uncharacterized protein n=1 Tax=Protopolystoma xenopodis TaxID=117903 RepID=A0A448XFK9_9PLAT|nr:unnamed protein product [Protopolystoma xenopodis]
MCDQPGMSGYAAMLPGPFMSGSSFGMIPASSTSSCASLTAPPFHPVHPAAPFTPPNTLAGLALSSLALTSGAIGPEAGAPPSGGLIYSTASSPSSSSSLAPAPSLSPLSMIGQTGVSAPPGFMSFPASGTTGQDAILDMVCPGSGQQHPLTRSLLNVLTGSRALLPGTSSYGPDCAAPSLGNFNTTHALFAGSGVGSLSRSLSVGQAMGNAHSVASQQTTPSPSNLGSVGAGSNMIGLYATQTSLSPYPLAAGGHAGSSPAGLVMPTSQSGLLVPPGPLDSSSQASSASPASPALLASGQSHSHSQSPACLFASAANHVIAAPSANLQINESLSTSAYNPGSQMPARPGLELEANQNAAMLAGLGGLAGFTGLPGLAGFAGFAGLAGLAGFTGLGAFATTAPAVPPAGLVNAPVVFCKRDISVMPHLHSVSPRAGSLKLNSVVLRQLSPLNMPFVINMMDEHANHCTFFQIVHQYDVENGIVMRSTVSIKRRDSSFIEMKHLAEHSKSVPRRV